jgi:hypothetical protein
VPGSLSASEGGVSAPDGRTDGRTVSMPAVRQAHGAAPCASDLRGD